MAAISDFIAYMGKEALQDMPTMTPGAGEHPNATPPGEAEDTPVPWTAVTDPKQPPKKPRMIKAAEEPQPQSDTAGELQKNPEKARVEPTNWEKNQQKLFERAGQPALTTNYMDLGTRSISNSVNTSVGRKSPVEKATYGFNQLVKNYIPDTIPVIGDNPLKGLINSYDNRFEQPIRADAAQAATTAIGGPISASRANMTTGDNIQAYVNAKTGLGEPSVVQQNAAAANAQGRVLIKDLEYLDDDALKAKYNGLDRAALQDMALGALKATGTDTVNKQIVEQGDNKINELVTKYGPWVAGAGGIAALLGMLLSDNGGDEDGDPDKQSDIQALLNYMQQDRGWNASSNWVGKKYEGE